MYQHEGYKRYDIQTHPIIFSPLVAKNIAKLAQHCGCTIKYTLLNLATPKIVYLFIQIRA